MHGLQNFDSEAFLAEFWQRKPLLIRNALPGFIDPVSADELAGLALEPEVESRIVDNHQGDWRLSRGPFQVADLQRSGPWTLLVQSVDQLLPEVADLRQHINFIPNWRLDDVMISYADDGGGVGPHYDNYDVFLLQGKGQREWRLGDFCTGSESRLDHEELCLLADMPIRQRYLLSTGDILYVPPGLSHWGVAVGECLTYSIGFRAPRINNLLERWLDRQLEQLDGDRFYTDPSLEPAPRPGEISQAAVQQALDLLKSAIAGGDTDPRWFGELVTEPGEQYVTPGIESLPAEITAIALATAARLAWQQKTDGVLIFANGSTISGTSSQLPLIECLCRGNRISQGELARFLELGDNHRLLQDLLEAGCLHVEP